MARLQSISAPLASSPNPISPGNSEIVDLSSPHGSSVNDAIPPELASLHYPRVDQTAALIAQHGWGALIAKLDLHSAYRKIPVHPDDSMLLGIKWLDTIYIDRALPFGLRSASKLFTAVADGFAWALVARGYPDFTHYLDDYLFWSAHDSPACRDALNTALQLGSALDLSTAINKVVGPSTTLFFLGIEIDTVAQQLHMPAGKLVHIKRTLQHWSQIYVINPTKQQLQSLIRLLNHTASVVPPGHTFMQEIISNMKNPAHLEQQTCLMSGAKADIAWWLSFIDNWNRVGFFHPLAMLQSTKWSSQTFLAPGVAVPLLVQRPSFSNCNGFNRGLRRASLLKNSCPLSLALPCGALVRTASGCNSAATIWPQLRHYPQGMLKTRLWLTSSGASFSSRPSSILNTRPVISPAKRTEHANALSCNRFHLFFSLSSHRLLQHQSTPLLSRNFSFTRPHPGLSLAGATCSGVFFARGLAKSSMNSYMCTTLPRGSISSFVTHITFLSYL